MEVETRYFAGAGFSMVPWQQFGAYQYWKTPYSPGPQKLQMAWPDNIGDDLQGAYGRTLDRHEFPSDHLAWKSQPTNIWQDKRTYMRTIPEHYTGPRPTNDDFIDHVYPNNIWKSHPLKDLINELDPDPNNDKIGEQGHKEPARTHTKPIDIVIWGALNAWNYIPVKIYKAYLIAPLRYNVKSAIWFDGQVNGSPVAWQPLISLTDFRGYDVATVASGTTEQKQWAPQLWEYYEVQDPIFRPDEARFAFKVVNGNLVIDNTLNLKGGAGMTRDELYQKTNGNVDISFTSDKTKIYFWNNGGSRIEAEVKVWLPVIIDYGLGRFDGRIDQCGIDGWVKPHTN